MFILTEDEEHVGVDVAAHEPHEPLAVGVAGHVAHGHGLGQELAGARQQDARVGVEREEAKEHENADDPAELGDGRGEQEHTDTDNCLCMCVCMHKLVLVHLCV